MACFQLSVAATVRPTQQLRKTPRGDLISKGLLPKAHESSERDALEPVDLRSPLVRGDARLLWLESVHAHRRRCAPMCPVDPPHEDVFSRAPVRQAA